MEVWEITTRSSSNQDDSRELICIFLLTLCEHCLSLAPYIFRKLKNDAFKVALKSLNFLKWYFTNYK